MEGEIRLKKIPRVTAVLLIAGFALLFPRGFIPIRPASAQTAPPVVGELSEDEKDRFQASQWLRLADQFWETGDYPQLTHFCRLILTYYPDTEYAKQAQKLLKKSANPSVNRSREYRRNNPALFFR